jgi:hypothetical protein
MGSSDWGGGFRVSSFGFGLATFPGIVVHEAGHVAFCLLTGTRVMEVCWFQLNDPIGYVQHERPTSVYKSILISVGPFFVNTLVALGIGLLYARRQGPFDSLDLAGVLLLWLGVSVGMNAFPSTGDAECIWHDVYKEPGTPVLAQMIGTPLVGIIYLGALASAHWFNLVYGVIIAAFLPYVVLGIIAASSQ